MALCVKFNSLRGMHLSNYSLIKNRSLLYVKEEHFIDELLVFSASYKDFKKENSILFPTDIKIEFHKNSSL